MVVTVEAVVEREVLVVTGLLVVPATEVAEVVPFLEASVSGDCVGLFGTTGEVGLVVSASWDLLGPIEKEQPGPDVVSLPFISVVGEIPAIVDDCCDDSVDSLITRTGPAGADDASEGASVFCPQAEHSSARAAAKAIISCFVI